MPLKELSKTKSKEFKALSSKKERDKTGLFLAEGSKCVEDMLDSFELTWLICTSGWLDKKSKIKDTFADKILMTDKKGIEAVSSLNSLPEVVAIFKKPDNIETLQLDASKLYLMLDEIQDPGNLGTIIRTCDWFGVYDIFASKTTVDAFNPKVVQATMGSLSRVRVHYADLRELLDNCSDFEVMGALLDGMPIDKICRKAGFLIMGNEGKGISKELMEKIKIPVTIPPKNTLSHPDSLNVAVATAICLSRLT